jgi:hypothetical protein
MITKHRAGLIGHTGFVGGALARAAAYDARFNSSNVDELRGKRFELLVCAGVSAVKWVANKDPDADRAAIARLTDALAEAEVDEFVLISTIDVYPDPTIAGNEATKIDPSRNHTYGRHRLQLERWCTERFPVVRIVRLPALFGTGLRKNAIYDLLHGNMLDSINPAAVFQWYPLERLWADIAVIREARLELVNLFPEPIMMSCIIDAAFKGAAVGPVRLHGPRYDMRTRHGRLFGGDDQYISDAGTVLGALLDYVEGVRAAAP